jgi:hypothetical protein
MIQNGSLSIGIVVNRHGGHVAPDTVSLRYFLVLAQELNFTHAAARIGIAQPALSARMRRLETELGTACCSATRVASY